MSNAYDRIYLVTTIFLVQHGDKERLPGDPGLTELGKRQAEVTARWLVLGNGESSRSAGERLRLFLAGLSGGSSRVAVVSHGGVTVDLLRNLLGDDGLPARLMADGIPPCAITTLDDFHVVGIAATGHLAGL